MDIKGRSDYFSHVHSLSGLFAFSALTSLQHLAIRICFHSRNAISQTLRGILHGVRKYLDLPESHETVFFFFFFFIANDIGCGNQTKCKAILLSAIGEKTYRVLEDLCTPQKPSDKSLEKITSLLLEHFKSKHLVVAESFKFYKRRVSQFLIFLFALNIWKRALCDKFVCGLKDDKIQEKLLSEDKSLEEAVKMAKAMELAMANVAHIKEKETNEVNKMCAESNAFELQKKKVCFGCGGKWHERHSQFPAWGKTCFKCNIKNHFSRHCKNKQRGNMSH